MIIMTMMTKAMMITTAMMTMTKSYLKVAQLVQALEGLITKSTFLTWFRQMCDKKSKGLREL